MSNVEEELRLETIKWIKKAEEKFSEIREENNFVVNAKAYLKDSKWFLEKGELIKAFECIIWAWAWIEIAEEIGLIKN